MSLFGEDNYLYHEINANILVADSDRTAADLREWTEEQGGYMVYSSTRQVILRVPYQKIPDIREFLKEEADTVVHISPQVIDLRDEIAGLESEIQSREEILERNLEFIDQTDTEGTLTIEQEVLALLTEIEDRKGRLRKLNQDRVFAYVKVDISFLEQTLPGDIASSFGWINQVDFYSFMNQGYYR